MRRPGINKKTPVLCKVYRENKNYVEPDDPYEPGRGKRLLIGEVEIIIKDNYSYTTEKFGDHVKGHATGFYTDSIDIREGDTLEGQGDKIGRSYKVIGDPREGIIYTVVNVERIK